MYTIDDLTGGQVQALATIARVNLNAERGITSRVHRRPERINKWSVRALVTRGIVTYDPKWDAVRILDDYAALAEECRRVLEEGPR